MRTIIIAAALTLAACQPMSEQSETTDADTSTETTTAAAADATMGSVDELTIPDGVQTELQGARVPDPALWPASLYSRSAGGRCTSSLVGPQVLLTAAHCVANNASVSFTKAGQTYTAVCEHAPGYQGGAGDETADYALCAVDRVVPNVPYERISTNPAPLRIRGEVLLTGFGCVTNTGTGGNDGVYRIGEARITELPQAPRNDIEVAEGATLCFGDSGGPAFLVTGNRRAQISVNSRVQRKPDGTLGPHSYLSSLSTPEAIAFIQSWRAKPANASFLICGYDQGATGCRS